LNARLSAQPACHRESGTKKAFLSAKRFDLKVIFVGFTNFLRQQLQIDSANQRAKTILSGIHRLDWLAAMLLANSGKH
jgi:hypothetical protein